MTLFEKVIANGTYDTKKYRYILVDCGNHGEIQRLELKYLNTTRSINGWETVYKIERR